MSRRRAAGFSRGGLFVGLLIVCLIGGAAAFLFARVRPSLDAGHLIYASDHAVYIHDLKTGSDKKVVSLPSGTVVASASPDGQWIGYGTQEGAVWLVRIDGTQRFQLTDQLTVPVGWTPDGKLVVGELASDGDLVAVDPEGARTPLMTGGHLPNTVPVWLDTKRFAIAKAKGRFSVIKDDDEVVAGDGVPLAASPDGTQLMYQDKKLVKLTTIKGSEFTNTSVVFKGEAENATTSPDGFVALIAKDIKGHKGVWILEGGTKSKRIVMGSVDGVQWTHTGAVVIYLRDGALYAQDAHGGRAKRVSRKGVKVLPLLSFSVSP